MTQHFHQKMVEPLKEPKIIQTMTSPFNGCSCVINKEYAKEMCTEIQDIVLERLENMDDDEMKDIDRTTISNMLTEFKGFLCIGIDDEDSVDQKLESVKLSMALRFLKSSNMKKRLNGINQIKSIIEFTERSSSSSDHMRRHWQDDDSPRVSRWLKPEYLCNWLLENQLLEYILGENSHVEVVKRSTSVLKFLSNCKALTKDHLDLLWKCQEDKHEATVLGVYETINEVALDLEKDALDYIFTKIESIPLKKYNEQTVNFVKEFTSNACRVSRSSPAANLVEVSSDDEEDKDIEFFVENAKQIVSGEIEEPKKSVPEYGLPIIFKLLEQSNDLGSTALKALIEILRYKHLDMFKISYILKSIKNLQDGKYVHQSLTIITSILPKCFNSKDYESSSQSHVAIMKLNEHFDFIKLTIKNIERYNEVVQSKMVGLVNKGTIPENIPKTCFEGNILHSDHLEKLLEFIEFSSIYTGGEITIGQENIEKLWNLFVNTSGIEFDKNLFLKWMNKERFTKGNIQTINQRRIFTSDEREYIFNNILCQSDQVDKKEITYNCFK